MDYVRSLIRTPHLKYMSPLQATYRNAESGRIHVIDISTRPNRFISSQISFDPRDRVQTDAKYNLRSALLKNNSKKMCCIVEDLSEGAIETIGSILELRNPEVFVEHLHNSGHGPGGYEPNHSHHPTSNTLANHFISIRWFRAGYYSRRYDLESPERLRTMLHGDFADPPNSRRRQRTFGVDTSKHQWKAATNIFRRFVLMNSKPERETNSIPEKFDSHEIPCVWEEKASMQITSFTEGGTCKSIKTCSPP